MSAKKYTLLLSMILLLFFSLHAEEGTDPEFDLNINLGLGVDNFSEDVEGIETDVTYQKLALSPDVSFGKIGIGLDVTFHYRFEEGTFQLRQEDWVPETIDFQNIMALYLPKFRYARYGIKGDPLFVKLGIIEDGRLANGFVMGNYSNALFLPDNRIFGLSLDLDGSLFDAPILGIETHVGNLAKPDVFGARFFIRPFSGLEIPVLNRMEWGITEAFDINPFAYATADEITTAGTEGVVSDGAMAAFTGFDIMQPILGTPILSLAAYGDAATYKFESWGGMLGFGGTLISLFNYGAQLRMIGDGFIPTYFNQSYDLSRVNKYLLMEGTNPSPGFVGWLASFGTSILDGLIALNFSVDGSFTPVDPDNPDNYLNYPHLMGSFVIGDGLIPGLSMEATYDKIMIQSIGDLINFDGAIILAKINYQTGPAVLSLFYQVRYTEGQWDAKDVTSGLESLIQLN